MGWEKNVVFWLFWLGHSLGLLALLALLALLCVGVVKRSVRLLVDCHVYTHGVC